MAIHQVFGEQWFPLGQRHTPNWWQTFNIMSSLIQNLYHGASLRTEGFKRYVLRQKRVTRNTKQTSNSQQSSKCKCNFLEGKPSKPS